MRRRYVYALRLIWLAIYTKILSCLCDVLLLCCLQSSIPCTRSRRIFNLFIKLEYFPSPTDVVPILSWRFSFFTLRCTRFFAHSYLLSVYNMPSLMFNRCSTNIETGTQCFFTPKLYVSLLSYYWDLDNRNTRSTFCLRRCRDCWFGCTISKTRHTSWWGVNAANRRCMSAKCRCAMSEIFW